MRESGNVTKKELVEDVAFRTGMQQNDTKAVIECFMDSIARTLAEGNHIEIRGFGRFKIRQRGSYNARNPRSGETVTVPAQRKPVFEPSKELKKYLNPDREA
jgi:DNA-binding protein HU-beta/integration host factor subunit beta